MAAPAASEPCTNRRRDSGVSVMRGAVEGADGHEVGNGRADRMVPVADIGVQPPERSPNAGAPAPVRVVVVVVCHAHSRYRGFANSWNTEVTDFTDQTDKQNDDSLINASCCC